MAAAGRFLAEEVRRDDSAALSRLFADILGEGAPAEALSATVARAAGGRLVMARDDAGNLMLMPFEVSADGSGTIGSPIFHPRAAGAEPDLVAEGARKIAEAGARTLHIAVTPGDPAGGIFERAGFIAGPTMVEMEGAVGRGGEPASGIWRAYEEVGGDEFARLFYRTLEGSLDFPELPVCRDPVALMRAMEERGDRREGDFAALEVEGSAAGVLMLARAGPALNMLYMGIVPERRGRGLSDALLRRAFEQARRRGLKTLTLMVDGRNGPAMARYGKFGLSEKRAVRVYYRVEKKT